MGPTNNKEPKYYLKTLGEAFRVLDYISKVKKPIGIAELSRALNMGKSKLHRILSNLRYWGLVEQTTVDKKYFLGLKILEIAKNKLMSMDIIKIASMDLEELLKDCHETVHLASLNQGKVLYLDKKQGPQAIGIISKIGQRLPAYCTGLGKVLLAFLDEEEINKNLENIDFKPFTSNTITSKDQFIKELEKVRNQGFAEDHEEIEEGLCCIAAPIKDFTGKVVAAASVSIPSFRFNENKKKRITSILKKHTKNISIKLGYNQKWGG